MGEPHVVTLRPTRAADLDALFRFHHDETAVHQAAFAPGDDDRPAFDARWVERLADPELTTRTVRADGRIVGDVEVRREHGVAVLDSWIDPEHWGLGIATRALRLLLDGLPERPVRARVAADNRGSRAVLAKLGFAEVARELVFAPARGGETERLVYELD